MQDGNNNQPTKIRFALIGIAIAAALFIITISVLAITLGGNSEANVINESSNVDADSGSSLISSAYMSRVKKALYDKLNDTDADVDNYDVAIRWDTLNVQDGDDPSATFLVDIDASRQTYRVTVDDYNVILECPSLGESKYPESFCTGNYYEDDDSISVVFGSNLPYEGYTRAHEYFSISRNHSDITDRSLHVVVLSCSKDQSAKDRANESVDEVITSLGASPSLFERKISIVGCHGQ